MNYIDNLLTSNETILIQRRRHPIQLIGGILGLGFQVTFWLILYTVLNLFGVFDVMAEFGEFSPELTDLLPTFVVENLLLSFLGLIIFLGLFRYIRTIIQWFNNYDILTNRRVIQVRGVLSKYTSETSLEKINDVNLSQSTFGRLFGYGNLVVMTASEAGISYMWFLPDPLGFKKAMMDAKEALDGGGNANGRAVTSPPSSSADLTTRLARLDELYHQKLISETEYQARRARILDEV